MENKLESAAIIAASLLHEFPNPPTEKIVELLVQSLDAVDGAESVEKKRMTQKHSELRSSTLVMRR